MSYKAPKCSPPRELVPPSEPIVFVIGSMAHGKVTFCLFFTKTVEFSTNCKCYRGNNIVQYNIDEY